MLNRSYIDGGIDMSCPLCESELQLIFGQYETYYKCLSDDGCDVIVKCDEFLGPSKDYTTKSARTSRMIAHKVFDRIWLNGHMSRSESYVWMAETMDLSTDEAHIANFDKDECAELINHVKSLLDLPQKNGS